MKTYKATTDESTSKESTANQGILQQADEI